MRQPVMNNQYITYADVEDVRASCPEQGDEFFFGEATIWAFTSRRKENKRRSWNSSCKRDFNSDLIETPVATAVTAVFSRVFTGDGELPDGP